MVVLVYVAVQTEPGALLPAASAHHRAPNCNEKKKPSCLTRVQDGNFSAREDEVHIKIPPLFHHRAVEIKVNVLALATTAETD